MHIFKDVEVKNKFYLKSPHFRGHVSLFLTEQGIMDSETWTYQTEFTPYSFNTNNAIIYKINPDYNSIV